MSEDDFLWPPENFEANDDPALAQKLQHTVDIIFAQFRRLQDEVAAAGSGGGSGPHDMLSVTHSDSLPAVPADGDLLIRSGGAWRRLPIGTPGQALIDVLGLPAWSNDGHGLLIDAGNLDAGLIPTARYLHDLLSAAHRDTTPAAPVLGDMVLAQGASGADIEAYWLDGQPLDYLPDTFDGGEAYWLDGLPAAALETTSAVAWARKANGALGYVWTSGATGPDWQPSSSGSSLGAAVYRASDFSLADRTPTKVILSTVVFDDGAFWSSGDPTRLTIPVGAGGAYVISGLGSWDSGQPGPHYARIYVNNIERASSMGDTNAPVPYLEPASVSTVLKLNAGDYVELVLEHAANVVGTAYTVKGGTTRTFLQLGRLNSESVVATGLPSPVAGSIIQGNAGSTAYDRLALGAAGTVLLSDGALAGWSARPTLRDVAEAVSGLWNFTGGAKLAGNRVGAWTNVPYNAGDFTAGGAMVWTVAAGDVGYFKYSLLDATTMLLAAQFVNTSVTAPLDPLLKVAVPGGKTITTGFLQPGFAIANLPAGSHEVVIVLGTAGTTYISIYRLGAINWLASVDACSVYIPGLLFEVNP